MGGLVGCFVCWLVCLLLDVVGCGCLLSSWFVVVVVIVAVKLMNKLSS